MDLGEHIELVGFSEQDGNELVVIKKIVGNYVKNFSEKHPDFERLVLTNKSVHASKAEIHGKLLWGGKEAFSTVTDNNLFFALDDCLKKLQHQVHE